MLLVIFITRRLPSNLKMLSVSHPSVFFDVVDIIKHDFDTTSICNHPIISIHLATSVKLVLHCTSKLVNCYALN